MDTFELGNFTLTTGFTLPNAKLTYTTHGTLNAAKDNAILFTNFIGGTDQALEVFIGEDFALDPRQYFIILPGQFGNGFSSSPSNTPPPYDRGAFPPINVADDIVAQHRLVTEHLGIQELQLVVGWSVGALQTYEWAVRFPEMVKRVAPTAGAPRPSAWTRLWLRNVVEEPITADPAWDNGFYENARALQAGARLQGHATALTVAPSDFFRGDGPAHSDSRPLMTSFVASSKPSGFLRIRITSFVRLARRLGPTRAKVATLPQHSVVSPQKRSCSPLPATGCFRLRIASPMRN